MRKLIKIGMVLVVLLSMVGFASATTTLAPSPVTINIFNNEVKTLTITHVDEVSEPEIATFYIRNDGLLTINNELKGSIDHSTTWGQSGLTAVPDTCTQDTTGTWTATWTFLLTDNGDSDDSTQNGNEYDICFEIYDTDATMIGSVAARGSATSDISAVPEFPTIALPVAAILGLAFIFQRRREEE